MPEDRVPPSIDGYGYKVIGWCKEAAQESDDFLRGQTGYRFIDESINTVMGINADLRSATLSGTECNQFAKTFLDMASGMTDTKPFWEFRTYNKRFEKNCSIYGHLSEHSWITRSMDLSFLNTVQYALCAGTSYLEPYWDPNIEDFKAEAWDPRDVLPIRPSTSPSIQECYGVLSRKARTVNQLRYLAKYVYERPDLVKYIQADRDGTAAGASLRNTRVGNLLQKMGDSPFKQRLFGDSSQRDLPRVPTSDLFTVYIDDTTENDSSKDVHMGAFDKDGKALNNWSYIVKKGERLYPRKRMIVYCSGLPEPLYDGPSPWWHGMYPFPKLTLDPVPWSFLGKAPMWDLLSLNKALNKLLRVYDDWAERLARPDIIANKQAIAQHLIDRMDTRRAGKKVRINPTAGEGFKIVGPDPMPADFWQGIQYYEQKIKELSGSSDLSSLMKLNQMPSPDTVEQMIEAMSLSWRMRSRVIEIFMREFATMMMYNYSQFYTLPRRLTVLGGDGVTMEDFDFDPGTMIPDFVDPEDFDDKGNIKGESILRGPLPRYNRSQNFLRQISCHIAPGSLLNASEWQRKMEYTQLSRAGLIDHWTLLDVLGIPNVGTPPSGATSITDRLMAEQQMGLGMQVNPVGRKASGQSQPRLTVKES